MPAHFISLVRTSVRFEMVRCVCCGNRTSNEIYEIAEDPTNHEVMCVACAVQEAVLFATAKGWKVGCTVDRFDSANATVHYDPSKLVETFNGGWADYYDHPEDGSFAKTAKFGKPGGDEV